MHERGQVDDLRLVLPKLYAYIPACSPLPYKGGESLRPLTHILPSLVGEGQGWGQYC